MIDELKHSRVLLYLGHKSDIFTLTAEEAIKLCFLDFKFSKKFSCILIDLSEISLKIVVIRDH